MGPRFHALRRSPPRHTGALVAAFYEELATRSPEETIALMALEGTEVVVLAEGACQRRVRSVLSPGQRWEATESAAGWVLLAGLPGEVLERRWPNAPEGLWRRLEGVRRRHMAYRRGAEIVELAMPVCPDGIRPEAALLISVPYFRWAESNAGRLSAALRELAARLSHRLGALTYMPYGRAASRRVGPSEPMSPEELQRFLEGPWAARLACVREDGLPHVVPVWYEWTGGAFLVTAWPGSIWADYVTRQPTVALTIDEPWPPMRRVLARGEAQQVATEDLPGGLEALLRRLGTRYLGAPLQPAPSVGERAGRWRAFRIVPQQIIARRERIEAAS